MHPKKQLAKKLFQNKEFAECKNILSEIIDEGNATNTIFHRMATVCVELRDFDDAKKYFQISINENQTNPSVYISFGTLLTDHFHDYASAESMFQKASKMLANPTNNTSDRLWFNYGKLMYKTRNFQKAILFYSKCTKERACVHYHFARCLVDYQQEYEKAKVLFQKAALLQPNIACYSKALAMTYIQTKEYHLARDAFMHCLQLTQHKDVSMLMDFSHFLLNICNENAKAIEYRQIACELDDSIQNIKLIMYGFDECIAYWNLSEINIETLQKMTVTQLDVDIFGGSDRIHALQKHFERILSLQNGIQLVIISRYDRDIVIEALQRAHLYTYFAEIIQSTNIEQSATRLANTNALKQTQILFIHPVLNHINLANKYCTTYHVLCEHPLNGLSLQNMTEIEQMMGFDPCFIEPDIDIKDILHQIQKDGNALPQIDAAIYNSIKLEIREMSETDCIETLPVIQWIHENWSNEWHKDAFLYFAAQFKMIRMDTHQVDFWMVLNKLPSLVKLAPSDMELTVRYAQALAYFKHYHVAEHYFKLSIKDDDKGLNYHFYAYFLYDRQRYKEAEEHFIIAMNYLHKIQHSYYYQSCVGCARSMEQLKNYQRADYYYKQAVQCSNSQIGKIQYFYGIFLFNHHRYSEAKDQLEIAVNHYPHRASNHFWFSQTLFKLKNFEAAEYHSRHAFRLDPHLNEDTSDWKRYHYDVFESDTNETNPTINPKQTTNYSIASSYTYSPPRRTQFSLSSFNPLLKKEVFSDVSMMELEKLRSNMQYIAQHEASIPLDKVTVVYEYYFNSDMKCVYRGKMKKLGLYFNDLFEMRWAKCNNKMYMISKIYNSDTACADTGSNRNSEDEDSNDLNYNHLHVNPSKSSSYMEKYRKEMETIAQHELYFNLSQFPQMYYKYFKRRLATSGAQKCKRIAFYFSDIFNLERSPKNNAITLVSKLYNHRYKTRSANHTIGKEDILKYGSTAKATGEECKGEETQKDDTTYDGTHIAQETKEDETTLNICTESEIQFERFWFIELNLFTEDFNEYYRMFVKQKMNDVAVLLEDEIEHKLKDVIGIHSADDLQIIMKHIERLRNENKSFIEILKENNLELHYPMFTENGIYTLKSLKYHIKCKENIQYMVESYIPGNNDEALVLSIWNIRSLTLS